MGLWGLNHYIIINIVWAGTFGIFLNASLRARGSPSKVSFYIWGSFQGPLKDRFHVCGFILFSLVILSGTFLEHPVRRLLAFLMCSCPGTCTSRATTRWSVPRREPVVCILWKRWKRDHHLPLLFLLLFQNILTAIITTNSNPGASDHHRLVRRARHRWAVRRRHGKARRLSRLSWILNISFAHFCQFLMFSFWTFFTNMSILDPLVIPVQYKFYNWQFWD